VDSQPKTQRSSREKTKCKHTVSNPNYSTELGWKWEKRGENSPFYRVNPKFPPPWPRVRAATGPRGCFTASARAHGRAMRVHAGARSRASADARMRPRGRNFYRADAVFTTSAGNCGHGQTSGRRPRTSGRKGRPDGHFHPKTSVMTRVVTRPDVHGRVRQTSGHVRQSHGRPPWRPSAGGRPQIPSTGSRPPPPSI
jgi:hypothetical protein